MIKLVNTNKCEIQNCYYLVLYFFFLWSIIFLKHWHSTNEIPFYFFSFLCLLLIENATIYFYLVCFRPSLDRGHNHLLLYRALSSRKCSIWTPAKYRKDVFLTWWKFAFNEVNNLALSLVNQTRLETNPIDIKCGVFDQ